MRNEVDETNALLVKECEAAERSFEEAPPIIKETLSLVEDTDKINNLSAEVETLKVMLMGVPLFTFFMSICLQSCWITCAYSFVQ